MAAGVTTEALHALTHQRSRQRDCGRLMGELRRAPSPHDHCKVLEAEPRHDASDRQDDQQKDNKLAEVRHQRRETTEIATP